jgi:hypothetical protein
MMTANGLEGRRHAAPGRCRGRAAAEKGGGELAREMHEGRRPGREKGHGERIGANLQKKYKNCAQFILRY